MGIDKYGCFMQMYVYYYWNHRQHSMKSRHVSKVIDVFQRTCSCLVDTSLLFLCTEQFTDTNLSTFLQDRAAHFFWTCKIHIAYIIYYYWRCTDCNFLGRFRFFGSVTCQYQFLQIPIFLLRTIIDSIYKQKSMQISTKNYLYNTINY